MTQHELELKANDRQVGGDHYKKHILEHWDTVALFNLDYFQGNAWKYILRWRDKGKGIQDLEKARHYLDKYIEIETLRSQGILTKALLERAIRELEGFTQEPAPVALYRAMAKGDDPVGDVLSPFPFTLLDEDDESPEGLELVVPKLICKCLSLADHNDNVTAGKCRGLWGVTCDDPPLEVGDQPDDDVRFRKYQEPEEPTHFPHAHPDRSGCTHDSIDCPVHPNGGCPPRPAADSSARP